MKPLAPHGTYARFVGRPASNIPGCRCTPCNTEGRRYLKRRDYMAATGRALTVDATRTRTHLNALFDAGAGWNQITAAIGCSSSTISRIVSGQHPVRRSTQDAILALRPEHVLKHQSVPALGSTRRVQALAAIGHSGIAVAKAAGLSKSIVHALLNGDIERVYTTTHDAIARVFPRLALAPGNSSVAKFRAQREGWPSPLAWDWDRDLDDPAAVPITDVIPGSEDEEEDAPDIDEIAIARLVRGDHTVRLNQNERPIAARQMAKLGLSPFAAATALHTNVRSVRSWLEDAA
jgi:hypothetical protein